MKSPKRILVPTDLSNFSLIALTYAEEIAQLFDASVAVVCVVESETKGPPERAEAADEALVKETRDRLTRMMVEKEIAHAGVEIVVRHGKAAASIVRTAKEMNTDLIVMSTHGRTGLGHVLMGSVAEKVVRYAPCPVLTIKPEEFREIVALTEDDVAGSLHLPAGGR